MPIDISENKPPAGAPAGGGPTLTESTDAAATVRAPASVTTLWALYALEVITIGILRIPHDLGLFMFAFGDRGSWLVAQYLDAHGARPTIDFGFPYGLLPLLFGRAWFATFGLTPTAFNTAMMAGGVAMAFGVARFANGLRLDRTGQLLIVVALPVAIQSTMPGFSHLLEAVALCLAIGEHARGNRGAALALATAACFAKAALAYLYGFLLVLMIVADCRRSDASGAAATRSDARRDDSTTGSGAVASGAPSVPASFAWRTFLRTLMPAVVTAVVLLALVGPVFGVRPTVASLLPLNGMKIYQSQHFSFFTPWARTFWDPRSQPLGLYFATVAPFWLSSSIWLAFAGLIAGTHLLRSPQLPQSRSDEPLHQADHVSSGSPENRVKDVGMREGPLSEWIPVQIFFGILRKLGMAPRPAQKSLGCPSPTDNSVSLLRDEIVFCCAVLQTLFVLRFFGPPTSWTYYPYILVMGVAAACMMNSVTRRITIALVFVAFIALDASLVVAGSQWKTSAPSSLTAGLWADAADRTEWSTVIRLITGSPPSPGTSSASQPRDKSAALVTREVGNAEASSADLATGTATERQRAVAIGVAGAASILFPQFEKPLGAYLVRDEATPAEVARIIEQIKGADFVVRPASVSIGDPIYAWPEMVRAFDNFDVIFKGHTYQVLHHR